MSPVSPGDKQEAGDGGVGGASVKCGGSRLMKVFGGGAGRAATDAIGPFSLILMIPL